MAPHKALYNVPHLLERVFPVGEEEVAFFRSLLPPVPGLAVVDLGGGTGSLLARLDSGVGVNLEMARALLRSGSGIYGDLRQPPLRDGCAGLVYSRLFAVAYAMASEESGESVAVEIGKLIVSGGALAIEVPIAYDPRKLQGLCESFEEDFVYTFRYFDLLRKTPWGAVLAAEIEVLFKGERHLVRDPLHVYTPEGIVKFLGAGGIDDVMFFAPYDLETGTRMPPDDCLRGVVVGRKR